MKNIKRDFPILKRKINGKLITYLDSAAMSLKPKAVIDAVTGYYEKYCANVFRGIYRLSEEATQKYEETREKVANFINARSEREVIFVRNTTEAINLVTYCWGRLNVSKNDEIMTTIMEHHSNFIPWQQLCIENGAILKILDIDNSGKLILENFETSINKRTKIIAITYVSNTLGTINPLKKIIKIAKSRNPQILILVDAAQAVPHLKVDVQDLNCDFLAFSGQKMLGPTGAGVLWGKEELLKNLPPFMFGGEMIKEVFLNRSTFVPLPHKFEAGTPHIAGVIGLGAAIDYLNKIGINNVQKHEKELTSYTLRKMAKIKNLTLYGSLDPEIRSGVIIFNLKGIHAHDVAQVLDEDNIYVRAGHHCAMPLHNRLKIPASTRTSFYIYNTKKDADDLIKGLEKVKKLFG